MKNKIRKIIKDNSRTNLSLMDESILTKTEKIVESIFSSLKQGKKILICGNGGSAAQAQHMAGELLGRFEKERVGLSAVGLTTDTSIITAIGNDYDFDRIFERQIESIGNNGDILLSLSTSGNSANIIKAIKKANEQNIKTISLLGGDGGKAKKTSFLSIVIPSNNTPRIQETHILLIHIICELIEEAIC